MHELSRLHHASARDMLDRPAVRARVGVVVVDDGDHRQLLARHIPKRGRTEDERTVADQANDLLVGARQLDPGSGSDTRTEMRAIIEEQLAPAEGIEAKAVQTD